MSKLKEFVREHGMRINKDLAGELLALVSAFKVEAAVKRFYAGRRNLDAIYDLHIGLPVAISQALCEAAPDEETALWEAIALESLYSEDNIH